MMLMCWGDGWVSQGAQGRCVDVSRMQHEWHMTNEYVHLVCILVCLHPGRFPTYERYEPWYPGRPVFDGSPKSPSM